MQATVHPFSVRILQYEVPLAPRPLARAAAAEVRSMPLALQAWLGFLLAIISVAAVAALVAIPPGWEVFGTTPSFEWGLMIVGYVFFAIMTSGLCLASALGTVFGIERFRPFEKRHCVLAILSLSTAFLIIALDLHYPIRMVLGAVLVPSPSSPMWWMGVFYGLYLVVLLVEVWSMFTPHPKIHMYSCAAAATVAIFAPATLGAVFGVLNAKAFFNGPFTPVLMVASAFLAGTALLGIVFYVVHRFRLADWRHAATVALPSVRVLMLAGIALVTALLVRQIVAGLDSDVRGLRAATTALLTGPLAPMYWTRVLGGLVIPAMLLLMPMHRRTGAIATASFLALAGVALDRFVFVMAGQIAPVSAGAGTLSYPFASYVPSMVEIAIIGGAAAVMALGYTLAERYLDMGESDTHMFLPFPWIKKHDETDEGATHHLAEPSDLAPAAAMADRSVTSPAAPAVMVTPGVES